MKLSRLALAIIISLSINCFFSSAYDAPDQTQTSGGDPYTFYYDGHKWAKQEFFPTYEKITKVKLPLNVDYTLTDPCVGTYYDNEKAYIEIRDTSGSTVAQNHDVRLCGMSSSGMDTYPLTQTEDLDTSESYHIVVLYRGYLLSPGLLKWDRSTSDTYPGDSETHGEGVSTHDFRFTTYGYTPVPTCEERLKCDATYTKVVQVHTDCTETIVETCTDTCEFGSCVSTSPKVTVTDFTLRDTAYDEKSEFDPEEDALLYASVGNTNGRSGDYTIHFKIYQDTTLLDSHSETRTAPAYGLHDNPTWTYTIPGDATGAFRAEARVSECTTGCLASAGFTIATPCTDSDGDGYFSDCTPTDCDDTDTTVNPGAEETPCDGTDNDCDPSTPDDPDQDLDSYGVCTGDCDDTDSTIHPGAEEHYNNGIDEDCDGSDATMTCTPGTANCDSDWSNGCEKNIMADESNCGSCGNECGSGEECISGKCELIETTEVLEGDFIVLSRGVFLDIAEELSEQNRVNDFFFQNMSEEDAEMYISKLVEQMKDSEPTEDEILQVAEDNGVTQEEALAMLNDVDDTFAVFDFTIDSLDELNSILSAKDLIYVTDTIPVVDGRVMPDPKIVISMYPEEIYTGKTGSTLNRAVSTYSDSLGKFAGALSLLVMGLNIRQGMDKYNGSVAHGIVYAAEKQLDIGMFVCGAADWLIEVVVGPESPPISFTETYNSTAGVLISSIVRDAHKGAEGIDVCYANGELVECSQRNIELFTVLVYPYTWIEDFNLVYSQGSPLTISTYTYRNSNVVAGYTVLEIETVTDTRTYTDSRRFPIYGLETKSGTWMMQINPGETVINATLTTYTGCEGEDASTCQYWVDQKTITINSSIPTEETMNESEENKTSTGSSTMINSSQPIPDISVTSRSGSSSSSGGGGGGGSRHHTPTYTVVTPQATHAQVERPEILPPGSVIRGRAREAPSVGGEERSAAQVIETPEVQEQQESDPKVRAASGTKTVERVHIPRGGPSFWDRLTGKDDRIIRSRPAGQEEESLLDMILNGFSTIIRRAGNIFM